MMSVRVFSRVAAGIAISATVLVGGAVQSLAQTTATPQGGVVLATVNIKNTKIISQNGHTFDISFDLTNRVGVQSGVKYGILLATTTKSGQIVVDEKVYPEVLTLRENSSISKQITYTAPQNLGGTYTLLLTSKDESAFPFALIVAGNVKLAGSARGITIDPASCFLQVAGEKGSPRYNLGQGVDITQNENLALTCVATNDTSSKISATPSYETRYRSAYGTVVSQTGGETAVLSFGAGEKKTFSLALPKADKPQSYNVSLILNASVGTPSNTITAHYVISGSSATIQTLLLDKNFYAKGDTAAVTFIWSSSADAFPNSRIAAASPSAVSGSVTMTDGNGEACTASIAKNLSGGTRLAIALPVLKDCVNPRVTLALAGASGAVLAQRELAFTSPPMETPSLVSMPSPTTLAVIILVVLALLGGAAYMAKRKDDVPPPQPTSTP